MNKLNTGFSKLSDNDFDDTAQAIVAALTGNANFPTPTPTLATINGSIAAYQAALAMPDGQPRDAQVAATHGTLSKELEQLARNLELTPSVTDAMLATSGFEMRKIPTFTTEPVTAPGNMRLKQTGVSGVVQVMCDAVNRAQAYELEYTLDPNAGPWTDGGTFASTRGIGITGLTRGKDYWARIRAVGPNGAGAWSDPAKATEVSIRPLVHSSGRICFCMLVYQGALGHDCSHAMPHLFAVYNPVRPRNWA